MDVFTDTKSFFVLWVQDDLDDETLLFLPREERKPFTTCMQLMHNTTFERLFSDDTEMILARALERMSKIEEEEEEPKKSNKLRKLEDGTSCRECV